MLWVEWFILQFKLTSTRSKGDCMTDFDKPFGIPSREMAHFTNRVTEKAAFQRLLDLPEGENVSHILFYGVGGTGKTWLSRKLERDECDLPTARIERYNAALRVYTEEEFPQRWAGTTANIAITEWDCCKRMAT